MSLIACSGISSLLALVFLPPAAFGRRERLVMVVSDKPRRWCVFRLMPHQPKSNALSATYQRCCASLRVDSTFNQRFSSASTRLGPVNQCRKRPDLLSGHSVTARLIPADLLNECTNS